MSEGVLVFDKNFYLQNKIIIDEIVKSILLNTNESSIKLDSAFYCKEILCACGENTNLKRIIFDDTILTVEVYELAKMYGKEVKTDGVVPELEDNFDSVIVYNQERKLIGDDTYKTISLATEYTIKACLSEEEIFNLKYLKDDVNVSVSYDNYPNVLKVIKRLNDLGKINATIAIKVNNKKLFNMYFLNNPEVFDYKGVFVKCDSSVNKVSLKDYLKYEKRLLDMIAPAINLSPFEKFLFAYNITKKFKKYKENYTNKMFARKLYDVLDNEYIVCLGYAVLLGDLLDKLGIANTEYSVSVDTMYDVIPFDSEFLPDTIEVNGEEQNFELSVGHHARLLVHLVDYKYNIDGIFVSDPTWDNDMDADSYVYSLMSPNETLCNRRYLYLSFSSFNEFIFVNSINEFFMKVNIWLDRKSKKNMDNPEKLFVDYALSFIENLDILFYKFLVDKYSNFFNCEYIVDSSEFFSFIRDVGEYLVSKCNCVLDGNVFKAGIEEVYKNCYDASEDLTTKLHEVMEYNKEKYDKCFPKRYKIMSDGTKQVYQNEINKFDVSENLSIKI